MAKRRRVKNETKSGEGQSVAAPFPPASPSSKRVDPICIGVGLLAGTIVYLGYYPSDSVAVEKGDALWFGVLAIVISMVVWAGRAWLGSCIVTPPASGHSSNDTTWLNAGRISRSLDMITWALAAWMMLAALNSSPPGNLRMATNEAWLWVSAAAIFTAARRLMARISARRATLVLLTVCGTGLAVHGLHQYMISLPQNRAEYNQDPERILKLAGVAAPPGSAERMVFENRLRDGGPTGTFALANSLAAVLLVSVICAVGVLRFHWRQLQPLQRFGWAAAGILCAACLMAARSRSATLAALIGMALIFVASSRLGSRNRKTLILGLAGVSLLGVGCVVFIALAGNREWFEEAIPSLAVRLQYWRSTWQLVLDRPLFGAGPGNFQSIYERYREITTTEQVAEPHNLFFETLASGGFVGLGLLLLAMAAGLIAIASRAGGVVVEQPVVEPPDVEPPDVEPPDVEPPEDDSDRWLWLGAILSLAMIWLIGWASRHVPDLDASLFVLPIALIAAVVLAPSVRSLSARDLDSIVGAALIAILIHLMVAGGWTVPGVAIIIWIFAAMLTRRDQTWASHPWGDTTASDSSLAKRADHEHRRDQTPSSAPLKLALAVGCNLLILTALYLVSLRPVERQKRLLATAAMAQSSGQLGKARLSLEQASQADQWSPDAMLWLADFYCWKLILEGDTREVRRQWESCLADVKRRAGEDPAVFRMIGAQQLHVYQRYGEARDLGAAAETFEKAVQWSPANQWMMAQMAVVAEARGQRVQAKKLGKRAAELAELGGNIERALSRQQVYVARPLGRLADQGPQRQPADRLLSGLNASD